MNSGLILLNILDDLDNNEDVRSELNGIQEKANRVQVSEDLDKISRCMMAQIWSSKSSQSSTSGGS